MVNICNQSFDFIVKFIPNQRVEKESELRLLLDWIHKKGNA